ncbi:hypothetical protein X943_001502 [Babesia divergens]|uniref:Uncharacterized protein n=1 Tax=Babesia divergens TaxID=32595 RepID=A0AAD9LJ10_BABDI|nr:hypothetical protein X943_001502 [Babesia divergens]
MLGCRIRGWHVNARLCLSTAGCTRCFGGLSCYSAYKRVRLCDKPSFSLCCKSAELLRQGSHLAVLLDARLLESPLGNVIRTQSLPLAERILSEWRGQLGRLTRFDTVPTTMLLAESLDLRPGARARIVDALLDGLKFDTVLRFDLAQVVELPPLDEVDDRSLSQIAALDIDVLQSSYLVPILHAFSRRRGTSMLAPSGSITCYPCQPGDVAEHVRQALRGLTNAQIIAMWKLHRSLKSVILPLELLDGAITASQAVRAARLEETLQAANWGLFDDFREAESRALLEIETSLFFQHCHSDSMSC